MNKRALVIILLVLAAVVGFAAVTLMSKKPAPTHQAVKPAVSSVEQPPAGEPAVEGKPEADRRKQPADEKFEKPADKRTEKPAADARKQADKKQTAKADGPKRPEAPRRMASMQLMRVAMGIGMLEMSGKNALTPEQAKKVLAILTPLRSKPKLPEAEAEKALNTLTKVLTADQLEAMTPRRPESGSGDRPAQRPPDGLQVPRPPRDGMQAPRPPQGDRPTGTNERRMPDRNMFEDFNPFYTKASGDDPRAERWHSRMNEFFAALEKKAKS